MQSSTRTTWLTLLLVVGGMGVSWLMVATVLKDSNTPMTTKAHGGRFGQSIAVHPPGIRYSEHEILAGLQSENAELVRLMAGEIQHRSVLSTSMVGRLCDLLVSGRARDFLHEHQVRSWIHTNSEAFRKQLACRLVVQTEEHIHTLAGVSNGRMMLQRAQIQAGLDPAWMNSDEPYPTMLASMQPACMDEAFPTQEP